MSAVIKVAAVGLFWYGLLTQEWHLWIWAVILWEISSGFTGSIILWISGWGK